MKFYSVVTFGRPGVKLAPFYKTENAARRAAQAARETGVPSKIRVMEHETQELAASADISVVRAGERTIAEY